MMRKNVVWAVLVIATALVEATWLSRVRIQGAVPELTLLLVVYFAIVDGEERAMFTGALGGLFQDIAADAVLGHHVLCLVAVGYLAGRISTRLITDHPAVKAGLVLCSSLFQGSLYTAVLYLQDSGFSVLRAFLTAVVPGAFYTALVTPIVFFLLDRSFARVYPLQGSSL